MGFLISPLAPPCSIDICDSPDAIRHGKTFLSIFDAVLAADHAACALLMPLCICVLFACAINGPR